jgi:hypothetical protein
MNLDSILEIIPHNRLARPRDTTKYNVANTLSFRLASKMMLSSKQDRVNTNYGGNRQNIEKMMRELWLADLGYLLCQVDQAGAEALIVAYLCRNAKYRMLFNCGIKPHTYLALKLFKEIWYKHFDQSKVVMACELPIPLLSKQEWWPALEKIIKGSDNWPDNERYYHFAKKTIHASSYGMFPPTFRLQMLKESGGIINLSLEDATKYITGFHLEFPEIKEWHYRVLRQVEETGQLRNLFDFPYNVTYKVNNNDFKDLISWIPQSTVACITRQAFVKLQQYIELNNRDWHLLHDTHDSYLAQAPEKEIGELKQKMLELIQIELTSPFDNSKFRMKAEAAVGKRWAPYKKDKCEEGLK